MQDCIIKKAEGICMSSKTPVGNFMILADVDTLRHNIRSDQVVGTGLLHRSITPEPIVTVTV